MLLIALSGVALITAVLAARQFMRGNWSRARAMFAVSFATLAAWAIAMSILL